MNKVKHNMSSIRTGQAHTWILFHTPTKTSIQERDRATTRLTITYISANTPFYNYIYSYNHNTGMI